MSAGYVHIRGFNCVQSGNNSTCADSGKVAFVQVFAENREITLENLGLSYR